MYNFQDEEKCQNLILFISSTFSVSRLALDGMMIDGLEEIWKDEVLA
jgi:hypothetical protein